MYDHSVDRWPRSQQSTAVPQPAPMPFHRPVCAATNNHIWMKPHVTHWILPFWFLSPPKSTQTQQSRHSVSALFCSCRPLSVKYLLAQTFHTKLYFLPYCLTATLHLLMIPLYKWCQPKRVSPAAIQMYGGSYLFLMHPGIIHGPRNTIHWSGGVILRIFRPGR